MEREREETGLVPTNNGSSAQQGEISEAGLVKRREFGADQLEKVAETAAVAVAAQARAQTEARYVMALRRPRNEDDVSVKLQRACQRPLFVATARYAKKQGRRQNPQTNAWEDNYVEGWSVRFAEEAARQWGNILIETTTIYDDAKQRIVRVSVTDLETNNSVNKDVSVAKVVERKKPRDGQIVISKRVNTSGDVVFLVEASDDEMLQKEGALVAKARRNGILQVLPSWISEECLVAWKKTMADEHAKDPDAARKAMTRAFSELNVMPSQIEEYLQHPIEQCTPAELERLRTLYVALKDGETTWAEVVAERGTAGEEKPADDTKPARTTADLKAREKNKQQKTDPA